MEDEITIEELDDEEIVIEETENEEIQIDSENIVNIGPINYDKNYLHQQDVPSNEWIINHNLNKYPAISVIDSGNNEVVGEVEYIDLNNLKINFIGSFTGKATLN